MNSQNFSDFLQRFGAYPVGKSAPTGEAFEAGLAELETQLGTELLGETRDFLRVCGGHAFDPEISFALDDPSLDDDSRGSVQTILGFVNGAYDVLTSLGLLGSRLPKGFVPLVLDPGGNFVCLDASDGTLWFWDHETVPENAKASDLAPVAESLEDFLESWAIEDDDD